MCDAYMYIKRLEIERENVGHEVVCLFSSFSSSKYFRMPGFLPF